MTRNETPNTDTQLPSNIAKIDEAAAEAFAMVSQQVDANSDRRKKNKQPIRFTGFMDIDELTHGFRPGELTVITGAPGAGKSSLVANMATNMALQGAKVLFFAFGTSKEETALRMCASHGRIPLRNLLRGMLTEGDWGAFADAANKLGSLDLYICDDVSLTIDGLLSLARKVAEGEGRDRFVVLVDEIELLESPDCECELDWPRAAGATAIPLKRLAREIGAPVVAAIACEPERQKRSITDCERVLQALPPASAAIADSVLHISRHQSYDGADSAPSLHVADVMLAKHRLCPPQRVKLAFVPEYLRFMDYAEG